MRALVAAALVLACAVVAEARPRKQILREAWRRAHPGETAPPCFHADPARKLVADIDPAPGKETVLASMRWGILVLAADGTMLARDDRGCSREGAYLRLGIARVTGRSGWDLVEDSAAVGHCGLFGGWSLLARRGAALVSLVDIEDAEERQCGPSARTTLRAVVRSRRGRIDVRARRTYAPMRGNGFGPVERTATRTRWLWDGTGFRQLPGRTI